MLHMHHKKLAINRGIVYKYIGSSKVKKNPPKSEAREFADGISGLILSLPSESQVPALLGVVRLLEGKVGNLKEGSRRVVREGDPGYSSSMRGLNHLIVKNGIEVVEVLPWYPGCFDKEK